MKRIPYRRKGVRYHYFDSKQMKMTYDMGTTDDIERYKLGNYFDESNARIMDKAIRQLFKE